MKGEELEMLSRHDKQINDEIIPKLDDHDKRFLAHEERMAALEREQKEYRLEMGKVTNTVDAIKNSQDNLKDTLINTSNRQEDRLDKILSLTFDIKGKQVAADEKVTIAKLGTREKIIASILGVGGVSGAIVALMPVFTSITWPWE